MNLKPFRKFRINYFRQESGTAAVELAIAAPLLIFITLAAFTLVDLGQKKALVARAAMEGARMAVVKDRPDVEAYVKDIMKTADPSIDVNRIYVPDFNNRNNIPVLNAMFKPIEVTVTYDLPVFAGFGWAPKIKISKSYTFEKWDNAVIFDISK